MTDLTKLSGIELSARFLGGVCGMPAFFQDYGTHPRTGETEGVWRYWPHKPPAPSEAEYWEWEVCPDLTESTPDGCPHLGFVVQRVRERFEEGLELVAGESGCRAEVGNSVEQHDHPNPAAALMIAAILATEGE